MGHQNKFYTKTLSNDSPWKKYLDAQETQQYQKHAVEIEVLSYDFIAIGQKYIITINKVNK